MPGSDNIIELILRAKDEASSVVEKFQGELSKTEAVVDTQGSAFGRLKGILQGLAGILAAVGVAAFVKNTADATQELGAQVFNLQRLTGMTAESASTFIAVANHMGISADTLAAAVVNVSRRMGGLKGIEDQVVDSSGNAVDIFEKFGITIKNADGTIKPFSDVFQQISDRVRGTSSETERLAIATQFFRFNAAALMPILTMSKTQFQELAAEAKKYGLILTAENVTSIRQYTLANRSLDEAIQGTKVAIGSALIPVLTDAAKWVTEAAVKFREFIKENQALLSLPFDILKGAKDNIEAIGIVIGAISLISFNKQISGVISAFSNMDFIMNGLGGRVSRLSELWGTLTAGISTFTPGVLALSSALAALAGYGIGKLLDSLAYKLSLGEVDFSGLNRLNELTKELSEQHQFLGLKVAKNTELLKSLGFEGATAQRDFNDAVREGAVIYDQAAQKWRNLNQEQAAAARDEEERKNRLAEASKYVIAMNEAELKNFQATVHSEIELLTQQYDQGKITLENYYKERQQLEYEAATREVETLQATLQMLEQIPEKNREEIIKVKEEINQLIIKYADQELQTEQQKNEKILANFEKLKNREVEILTSTNEKKNAEDEAAEARGEISHEEALQRKLDRDKELQDEELKNADELMAKILENYTQDSDKYKEALATRTVLMNKFAADNIRAEQQITEEQQKEQQKRDQSRRQAQEQAQTDLQYINQHAREMDTAQIAEFQQLISDYYKQALISGKEYLDAYNTLIEAKTRALSRTLVDGIQAMLNAYNNAFNAMNNTLSAFKNNNDFSDVKAQFRSMTSALTQDYKSMQDELNRYQDSAWSKLWGSLQGRLNEMMKSVYLYGRNVTIMSLDQVRDWAQRVSDYVQRVQDLFAQLKDQLISWQDELDQLKGNEVAIVDRWYTEEVQKLKDKYGEDLKNTAEYQEALTLLQEIYAEKRKKAIEDEAAATQQAIEDINNALSGAAPPSKGSGGSSASSVDLTKTKVNPATDLLKAAQQAVNSTDWDGIGKSIGASVDSAITKINDAFQGAAKIMPGEIKVEKKVSLDSVLNFNVLPGSEAERYVNDVLWPLLMKKFQLTGINL